MPSTGHQGPFSGGSPKEETIHLPAGRAVGPDNDPSLSSNADSTGTAPYGSAPRTEDKPWKPSFNRHQSWNEQDMKHQFQERLLGSERGKESGFTEIGRRG